MPSSHPVPFGPTDAARARPRNPQNCNSEALRVSSKSGLPAVAAPLLTGQDVGFLTVLKDVEFEPYRMLLFGVERTSGATIIAELQKATEFHFYGCRRARKNSNQAIEPGLFTATVAQRKALLKKYARRAYRGDPERRGVQFWERTAWLVWDTYEALMKLRYRAETIQAQYLAKLERDAAKRAARAKYMREYRAKRRARGDLPFKEGARAAWHARQQARRAECQ